MRRLVLITFFAIVAIPAAALSQDMSADPADGEVFGQRTWQIFLKNGEKIEFLGDWNTSGAILRSHFNSYLNNGTVPTNPMYSFKLQNGSNTTSAHLHIDIREVIAIVQIFK